MPLSINILRWILRFGFLASLGIGVALWGGHAYNYLQLHMWIGFIITFALLALVALALLSRMRPILPLLALVWAVLLPAIGIGQLKMMPGANHWVMRVLHLIIGVGAIGFGEVLSKKMLRNDTPVV